MAGVKVGSLDIQFGPEWDAVKANQLVQSLQQVIGALRTLVNQASAAAPAVGVAVHDLASQVGLGADHTVAGLEANQVLIATGPTSAHFARLAFGQIAGTDSGTFLAPANGEIIAFVNGFWSAIPNTLGLSNPGADALIMWDQAANGGLGGLVWALPGHAIKLTSGSIAVDESQLAHGVSFAQASAITSLRL